MPMSPIFWISFLWMDRGESLFYKISVIIDLMYQTRTEIDII